MGVSPQEIQGGWTWLGVWARTRSTGEAAIQVFVRKAKAGTARLGKLSDGGGMYLTLTSGGTPVWRLKYWFAGDERSYTIGPLSAYPLALARKEREAVKCLLREGRDPVKERQLARAASIVSSGQTFSSLAEEWLEMQKKGWSEVHYRKSRRALERDVYPKLGRLPVNAINAYSPSDASKALREQFGHKFGRRHCHRRVQSVPVETTTTRTPPIR